jgi:tRNA(Ile)-lysidine synthase
VRHELLPVIERLAPGGLDALARTASLAADDEEYLSAAAIEAARSVVLSSADGVQLQRALLAALAPAVARRLIRRAIEQAAPLDAPRLTSRHIEAVWRLVVSEGAHHADLSGVRVDAGPQVLRVSALGGASTNGALPFELRLAVPGALTVLEAGWRISAAAGDQSAAAGVEAYMGARDALRIVVPARLVGSSVTIRSRRPGDRIKPIGAPGRKKLQDLLVDRKVPRAERDRVPVVVSASGQVVWVVGVAMADEFRVTAPESEVVVFKAERQ